MAYFLKKTTLKGRTYLAIYDSFYNHEKKGAAPSLEVNTIFFRSINYTKHLTNALK